MEEVVITLRQVRRQEGFNKQCNTSTAVTLPVLSSFNVNIRINMEYGFVHCQRAVA
jgi:hypothetical protein